VELSVLRAGGLSIFQMTMILLWEFMFLIIMGGSLGTSFGLLFGNRFIPFLQVGEGSGAMIPPFKVLVPWDLVVRFYWLFGILFVISLLTTILLLKRSRIFEAIKLGEST
jgi:putative ABC transport system permease protein